MPDRIFRNRTGRRYFGKPLRADCLFVVLARNNFKFFSGDPHLYNSVANPLDAPQAAVVIALYLLVVFAHSSSTSVIIERYSISA